MLGRFAKDESGVALGLAVIMIVLIGVMGAGLLVFVRNDLEAVIEVNQGQRAMDLADAGVEAAEQRLLGDKVSAHYDVDSISSPLYYASACNIGDESTSPTLTGPSWSPEGGGVTRSFAGGQFNVTIRWLSQDSLADSRCKAPETSPNVDYFQVVSTGTHGNAKRKVEAIYGTYDLGVPKGYFTPNSIEVKGTADVKDVSLFSLGNVTITNGAQITGTDLAYGNWQNSRNPTPRPTNAAGVGAAGTITGSPSLGTRDFHGTSTPPIFKMVANLADPATEITFPFDPNRQPDIDFLRDEAKRQEQEDPATQRHYYNPSNGNFSLSNWPDNSSENTVVFVEFSSASGSNVVKWDVPGTCTDNPPKKGTLIIQNGNFTTQPNKALFQGVVIVRGGEAADGDTADSGNTCLDGFINASGTIKIAGKVRPLSSDALIARPGSYGVRLWSWRELYE